MSVLVKKVLVSAVLLGLSNLATAQKIISVTSANTNVAVGEAVRVEIKLEKVTDTVNCGLVVDPGDGKARNIRIGQQKGEADLDYAVALTYDRPGNYVIQVEGKTFIRGFNTAISCDGNSQRLAVQVRDPEEDKRKAEQELAAKKAQLELEMKQELLRRQEQQLQQQQQQQQQREREARNAPKPAAPAPAKPSGLKDAF
jgi:hypothetical protein